MDAVSDSFIRVWHTITMTAPAWSATVASVALIVTIAFQILEWRRMRRSKSIKAILALEERFQSAEFRKMRSVVAASLVRDGESSPRDRSAIASLLDFFETLGFLFRTNALDAELIWHFFGYWLLRYHSALKRFIDNEQSDDPSLYEDLDKLLVAVRAIEAKRHPSRNASHGLSAQALKEFLAEEAAA